MLKGFFRIFRFNSSDIGLALLLFALIVGAVALFSFNNNSNNAPQNTPPTANYVSSASDSIRTIDLERKVIDKTNRETSADYVGPPQKENYTPKRRIPEGATVDLNKADSATLTLVPGIGPTYARRIVALRNRLGGYYTILQLQEVYGMTPTRYSEIKKYFSLAEKPQRLRIATLAYDSIPQHPYLSREQHNAIERILFRDGKLRGWKQLLSLECFSHDDSIRLSHYFIME